MDGTVSLWRGGDVDDRQEFYKRLEIKNIVDGIDGEVVESFIQRIYYNVIFEKIQCGKITAGNTVVMLKLNRINYFKFMSQGLKFGKWPPGVKVRFLKKNSVGKNSNSWRGPNNGSNYHAEMEQFRKDFEKSVAPDREILEIPTENNSVCSSEYGSAHASSGSDGAL